MSAPELTGIPAHEIVSTRRSAVETVRYTIELHDHPPIPRPRYDRTGIPFRPQVIAVTWTRHQDDGRWGDWSHRMVVRGVNVRKDGSDGADYTIPSYEAGENRRWAWALDATRPGPVERMEREAELERLRAIERAAREVAEIVPGGTLYESDYKRWDEFRATLGLGR